MPDLKTVVQRMIDAGESEENIGAVIKAAQTNPDVLLTPQEKDAQDSMWTQTGHEARGVVKGLIHSPVTAVKGLYGLGSAVASDLGSMWHGEYPAELDKQVVGAARNLVNTPKQFMDATHEDRGRMIGEALGSLGMAKLAPLAPRPIATTVGGAAETVGKGLGVPFRTSGIYKAMSGNMLGAVVAAAPSAVESGGRALRLWGENAPSGPAFAPGLVKNGEVAVPSRTLPPNLANAGIVPRRTLTLDPVVQSDIRNQMADSIGSSIDKAPGAIDKLADLDKSLAQSQREGSTTRKLNQQSDRQATVAETRADLDQLRREERQRVLGERQADIGQVTPPDVPPARPIPGHVTAPDPETANPNYVPGGPVRSPIRIAAPTPQPQAPLTSGTTLEAPSAIVSPSASDAAVQAFNERFGAGGAPPIRIAPETASILERTAKVPIEGNVPGSKSRGGVMSATPGLTVADAEALGLNPNIKITGLTPEAIKTLLDARANRASSYRINKGLDAAATRATDLEP